MLLLLLQRAPDGFVAQRQFGDARADGIGNGVGDRRRPGCDRRLADAARPVRPVRRAVLDEVYFDRRQHVGPRQRVVHKARRQQFAVLVVAHRFIKAPAEALRDAQLAMINGQVYTENGQLVWPGGSLPLPPDLVVDRRQDLSHPFYWAAFTLVGSPW